MNVVCLIGRLTTDPELKTTPSGKSVTNFTLAVDRAYTPKGEEKKTDFIDCVAWNNTAEFITRYFRKGVKIGANGELNKRTYTASDGSQRSVYEVKVDNAYFCEKNTAPAIQQNVSAFEDVPFNSDDIPF